MAGHYEWRPSHQSQSVFNAFYYSLDFNSVCAECFESVLEFTVFYFPSNFSVRELDHKTTNCVTEISKYLQPDIVSESAECEKL